MKYRDLPAYQRNRGNSKQVGKQLARCRAPARLSPLFLRHMVGRVKCTHAFLNTFAISAGVRRAGAFAHPLNAASSRLIGVRLSILSGGGRIAATEIGFDSRCIWSVGAL